MNNSRKIAYYFNSGNYSIHLSCGEPVIMKKVLILVFSNLNKDARVSRQVEFLKGLYHIDVACYEATPEGFTVFPIRRPKLTLVNKVIIGVLLLFQQFERAIGLLYNYKNILKQLAGQSYDLIIANDIETLSLAFQLKKPQTKIIFDAHEYAPRHFEDKLIWRLLFQPMNICLCKKYIPKTDGMITIGKGLADEYRKNFHVDPVIITNASQLHPLQPSAVNPAAIRLVHHGIATPSRRLELMIEMMEYLDDRFTLDMYLLSEGFSAQKTIQYPEELKQLAAKTKRVNILPPIKRELIVSTINHYDIGIFLIPPVNFNYANTLPNKFFDFIQARLAVAVGPTPEMAEIVRQYKLGVIAEDFTPEGMAAEIQKLTIEEINTYKMNADKAAFDLSAESNKVKLNALVAGVLHA